MNNDGRGEVPSKSVELVLVGAYFATIPISGLHVNGLVFSSWLVLRILPYPPPCIN